MKKLSKTETKREIEEFFKNIKNKTPKELKKIKALAMSKNIPLKDNRKLFCKKCLKAYSKPKIRVKNKIKSVGCSCGYISRWKV